jgi:putative transposase
MLPHDLPPWGTVWWYFRQWRKDGTWERIHETLRPKVREAEGREFTPSVAIIDSQSVKTTEKATVLGLTHLSTECPGLPYWVYFLEGRRRGVVDRNEPNQV